MRQYNFLQAFFMSFYSPDLYKDVARNWGGRTFLYLFMVLFLAWIVPTIQLQVSLNTMYKNKENKTQKMADELFDQIPMITLKDGKVITPENRPYVIVDPDSKEKIAIIDTSGQYTSLEQAKTTFLVTQDSIISQKNANEISIYKIPNTVNMDINPSAVKTFIQEKLASLLHYVWIPLFFLFLVFSYVYRIIQSLFYAVIGLLFGSMNGVSLTYGQIVQITMVALTPVIVASTVFDVFNIVFPFRGLFYFLLAMAYLWLGINGNKMKTVKE